MKSIKVYLIDDKEDDRELFCYALKAVPQPTQFDCAVSGPDALEQLTDMDMLPDYIFLDLNMPGMTGLECLEAMRQMPHLTDTPIIVYSGVSNRIHEQRAKALGASHYLIKPFSSEELTGMLANLLGQNEMAFVVA